MTRFNRIYSTFLAGAVLFAAGALTIQLLQAVLR
jgi:hypothetical protein